MAISDEQYGVAFSPYDIQRHTEDLLKFWFPEYLDYWKPKVETDYQRSLMISPVNYTTRNKFEAIKAEEIPKVVIMVPGIVGVPQKSGRDYRATWRLGIGVAIAAKTEEDADALVKVYGSIVRDIMMHHPSINHVAENTEWVDEQYNDIPIDNALEQYKAASEWFNVDIGLVVQKYKGPKGVPAQDATGVANIIEVTTEVV